MVENGSKSLSKKKEEFIDLLLAVSNQWSKAIKEIIKLKNQNKSAEGLIQRYLWYLGLFFIQNEVLKILTNSKAKEILDRLYYHCFKIMEKIGLSDDEIKEEEKMIKKYFIEFRENYKKFFPQKSFTNKLTDDLYLILKINKENNEERFGPDMELKILIEFNTAVKALQETVAEEAKKIF
jgi:hypothetical protein